MKRFQTDYGGFKPWVSTLFSRIFRKSLLARWREKKEEPTIPTKVSVGQAVTFFKCKGWEGGGLIGPEETVSLLRATIIGGGGTRLLGTPPEYFSLFQFSERHYFFYRNSEPVRSADRFRFTTSGKVDTGPRGPLAKNNIFNNAYWIRHFFSRLKKFLTDPTDEKIDVIKIRLFV